MCLFLRSPKDETEQEHKEHKVGLINGKTPTPTGTSSQMKVDQDKDVKGIFALNLSTAKIPLNSLS